MAEGYRHFKIKVGGRPADDDRRRPSIAREVIGLGRGSS